MPSPPQSASVPKIKHDEWVNNLNRTAISSVKAKMKADPKVGKQVKVTLQATWKQGVVTSSAHPSLVCYPPPELQLNSDKLGPTLNSFCPLISGGCFSLIMMMRAAEKRYHFESMTTKMTTHANVIGFYKTDWTGDANHKGCKHPWGDGIKLDIYVQSTKPQQKLEALAHFAEEHCPSSEIMKRDFPVEVDRFEVKDMDVNWDDVPVHYDMQAYHEMASKDEIRMTQQAHMTWHCHNENQDFPDSLMTFDFPHDPRPNLDRVVLSHDAPISSGKQASPVAACFFGGLSSYLHTVASRIYAHGYKLERIVGEIRTVLNKRKVMAIERDSFVFPEGCSIFIKVVSNLPKDMVDTIQMEADNMSPTMMNWQSDLPVAYEVHRVEPTEKYRKSRAGSKNCCVKPGQQQQRKMRDISSRSALSDSSGRRSNDGEVDDGNDTPLPPMLAGPGRVFKKWFGK